jgi:hypothetical protein
MGDHSVKSSWTAVGIGWVTTRCRPRIAPRLGMAGSVRRFAPRRPVWGLLAGYWAVLGVKESRRRLAPHRPVWGLLAGYLAVGSSPPVEGAGRRLAPHRPGRGLLAGYCPWEASPPLMAEAWSPVQIQLSWSPPVGGGLPVGCLASSDGGGLVPCADPSRGE